MNKKDAVQRLVFIRDEVEEDSDFIGRVRFDNFIREKILFLELHKTDGKINKVVVDGIDEIFQSKEFMPKKQIRANIKKMMADNKSIEFKEYFSISY